MDGSLSFVLLHTQHTRKSSKLPPLQDPSVQVCFQFLDFQHPLVMSQIMLNWPLVKLE